MQNIHTHVWDQRLHFSEQTVRESERSRGHALDLTVDFDLFMADMAPFDRSDLRPQGPTLRLLGPRRVCRGIHCPRARKTDRICLMRPLAARLHG